MATEPKICLSVVSHGQAGLVKILLTSLVESGASRHISVVLTVNVPEDVRSLASGLPFPSQVVYNKKPKGFAANQNQAFSLCRSPFFCVMNPDIILQQDPFPHLLSLLTDKTLGAVAPLLVDSMGREQDNARLFPTPWRIVLRLFSREKVPAGWQRDLFFPEWIAGMFMLFPVHVYRHVGGFDEKYFMYCEDADICLRMRRSGYRVALSRKIMAIHDARRSSHRALRHMYWHLSSLARFFITHPFYRL
ncbi:MAG TPA: glycosyltransferase family 2 protein [Desulfobulbaceae bacterium]|nr:glycosyltransferase family 2 protein [Desulfobulbaceae bacterium]